MLPTILTPVMIPTQKEEEEYNRLAKERQLRLQRKMYANMATNQKYDIAFCQLMGVWLWGSAGELETAV